jgi:tRNA U34 5-carboxymethylaminomethyl modifying GTPase MnmE/TrmE
MDPGNTTLLKQKQELLNESISKTEDVITALKDAKDRADADMANGTEINEKAYRELGRQIEANEITLKNTRKEADKVADALNSVDSDELRDVARAADDAEEALEALGELTGRTAKEEIVGRIFSRFCVGK